MTLTLRVVGDDGLVGRRVPHHDVGGDILRLKALRERADAFVVVTAVYELLVLKKKYNAFSIVRLHT